MNEVVSKQVAEQELNAWMDYKKIYPKSRVTLEAPISHLVDAIMYGDVSISADTHIITQKLKEPVSGLFDSLTYKPRMNVSDVKKYLSGIKAMDGDSRTTAYICALTDKGPSQIDRLDTEDNKTAQAIAVFFM